MPPSAAKCLDRDILLFFDQKRCAGCSDPKPIRDFMVRDSQFGRNTVDGRESRCRDCRLASGKANNLRFFHGITLEQYERMEKAQGGKCAICMRPERSMLNGVIRKLAVDHDHRLDVNRELLCSACNCALGMVGDDVSVLRSMIEYLERHGSKEKS